MIVLRLGPARKAALALQPSSSLPLLPLTGLTCSTLAALPCARAAFDIPNAAPHTMVTTGIYQSELHNGAKGAS